MISGPTLRRKRKMEVQGTSEGAVGLIDAAVNSFLDALRDKKVKLGVADVLRLLDLRKQIAHDRVREVKVRWVESKPAPRAIKL
jgi:hypothetical protein